MSFCEHCEGQRFDRARVLRVLRATQRRLREPKAASGVDHILTSAIETVRTLDIPHLERFDEVLDGELVH